MSKMTVAAALRRIKKLKGEISVLDDRIVSSASYLEGKEPPFSFDESLAERTKKVFELSLLQTLVAASNATTVFDSGGVKLLVVAAIKKLDEIKAKISLLQRLPIRDRVRDVDVQRDQEWSDELSRAITRTTERVTISVMSKAEQARLVSGLTSEFEELNVALEACNHSTYIDV